MIKGVIEVVVKTGPEWVLCFFNSISMTALCRLTLGDDGGTVVQENGTVTTLKLPRETLSSDIYIKTEHRLSHAPTHHIVFKRNLEFTCSE